eukprot:gnl/TRDRNA2_/TRDRNA2_200952_c0_seq1.p1 gnl/TRDRNA2_/TRDRNA2_200952_c0~~gnl/TRDRNA2_/TRDRNA2_200952_c0_seq1.p1  ORF type:complete len:353 (+),score=49.18 gnl/TRDRNA2_/TRDRNA2_200952_c0_seq1:61-1059(+)
MAGHEDKWEVYGLALVAVGVQFSVFANSLIKTINTVPVVQAMQVRFLISWLFTASTSMALRRQGRSIHFLGHPDHRRLLLGRATFFGTGLISSWTALRLIPVGDSTTIVYLYPMFTGILALWLLNEQLGCSFWSQALICFSGVLLVTAAGFAQTASASYQEGAALCLLAAFCYASANICLRMLKDAETVEVQLFNDSIMAFVIMPLTLLLTNNASDWSSWNFELFIRMGGATGCGLCALLLTVWGHQLAPASKVTLFTYLEVPTAFLVQTLWFGEAPGLQKEFGAALIVMAAIHRFALEASRAKSDKTALLIPKEGQNEQDSTHIDDALAGA